MSNKDKFQLEIRYPTSSKFNEKYRIEYVHFDSLEIRDKYIRDEFNFCKVEEKLYQSALYSNQRVLAVQNLYNKRIEFAKINGLV